MPKVRLATTDGRPFALRERVRGRAALLAFGYTNCPDVCPVYLSSIARAIEGADFGGAAPPVVLFVGVDLQRDTPRQLRTYLARIDSDFVGLTGTAASIEAANRAMHNGPITFEPPDASGAYAVVHQAVIFAFSPDGLAHRIYPPDTRQQVWQQDLPRLATGAYR